MGRRVSRRGNILLLFSRVRIHLFHYPDARRVAPIRASVGCLNLSQNGIIRQHKTQAQNASTNGGDASRVGKRYSYYLTEFVFISFLYPDAGRVALSLQQLSGAAANL